MADMSKYAGAPSNDLKAADFKGRNLKVVIESVTTRTYPARDGQEEVTKPVLKFVGKEKTLVVSPTNVKTLCDAYGVMDSDWVGHEIGLSTKEYEVGTGWIVTPLDIEGPKFDDEIPFN